MLMMRAFAGPRWGWEGLYCPVVRELALPAPGAALKSGMAAWPSWSSAKRASLKLQLSRGGASAADLLHRASFLLQGIMSISWGVCGPLGGDRGLWWAVSRAVQHERQCIGEMKRQSC